MSLPERPVTRERLSLETIPSAAGAIVTAYGTLKDSAVRFTPEYLQRRFFGEENATWAVVLHRFLGRERRVPLLDPVLLLQGNTLMFDAAFDTWGTEKIVAPYTMRKHTSGAIILERTGWTQEEGYSEVPQVYLATATGTIGEASRKAFPSINKNGLFPLGEIDVDTTAPVISLGSDLRSMIEDIHGYISKE
jgi:hypothetical protein